MQAGWRLPYHQQQGHPQKRGPRWQRRRCRKLRCRSSKQGCPHHHSLAWRQSRHVSSAWTAAMVSHVVGLVLRSTCEAGATLHAVDLHSILSACRLGCLTPIQWRPHADLCLCHPLARIAAAIGWRRPRVVCCSARRDRRHFQPTHTTQWSHIAWDVTRWGRVQRGLTAVSLSESGGSAE